MYYYERRRTVGAYQTLYVSENLKNVCDRFLKDAKYLEKTNCNRKALSKTDKKKHPEILLWIKFGDNHNNIILRVRKGE